MHLEKALYEIASFKDMAKCSPSTLDRPRGLLKWTMGTSSRIGDCKMERGFGLNRLEKMNFVLEVFDNKKENDKAVLCFKYVIAQSITVWCQQPHFQQPESRGSYHPWLPHQI